MPPLFVVVVVSDKLVGSHTKIVHFRYFYTIGENAICDNVIIAKQKPQKSI